MADLRTLREREEETRRVAAAEAKRVAEEELRLRRWEVRPYSHSQSF